MTALRWRVGSCLVVVMSLFLWAGGAALADDRPAIDMTGHWASPLEASGIDLVQSGNSVRGSSLSGLELSGTIDGRRVGFTYWDGPPYAKAHREDRGSGVMVVAKNGQRAEVTWRSDKKKAPEEGSFVIVRVGPPDSDVLTPALDDGPAASPGASLLLEEEADDLFNVVIEPSTTPAAVPDADPPTTTTSDPFGLLHLDRREADEILDFYEDLLQLLGSIFSGS